MTFRVPRSRASETHRALRAEIQAALDPILFGDYHGSYEIRAELESAFAAAVGARHAVAVHSGTIGLFLALRACSITTGDEVITVANSDISTTGAISQCGATPVLCDVFEDDYTINSDLVEALITSKTRAILPVDLHGHPANVKALRPIADQHGLKIVEDAALATGARDYSQPVGRFADAAMFSFAPFKPLGSAGNGAMVVTDDDDIHEELRLLTGYGYNPAGDVRSGYQDYSAEGYNVPLDGLQAALLLVKLPRLREWTEKRRAIAAALEAGLAGSAARSPRFRPESAPTFRSYAIRTAHQDELHQGLRAAGIEAVIHYAPPIHHYSVYAAGLPGADNLPVTEMLARQYVNLPVTPELTADEVNYMIETTRNLLQNM
ncbi:MAG: DegT/DnrJ/EryC1/StrS family aminotransferase [Chloroflexi bacterium]|nr:DegT/DnrJ/EryC1/StrS family aminotransferase [Chloroflexota bacterium]